MDSQSYDVELSHADYARGLAALMPRLTSIDKSRPRVLIARLVVTVVVIAGVMFTFPYASYALFIAIMLVWLGDALIQYAFQTQTLGVSYEPSVHARNRVEFGADGIVEQNSLRLRRWPWSALRMVHPTSGYVVLELAGWEMIVLPDTLWPSRERREAFVAELKARQQGDGESAPSLSDSEAYARVVHVEPVLIARIALAVMAFQLVFEPLGIRAAKPDQTTIYIVLGASLLAGALMWVASGHAFRWLVKRSAVQAIRVAWIVFTLLAIMFGLFCLGWF